MKDFFQILLLTSLHRTTSERNLHSLSSTLPEPIEPLDLQAQTLLHNPSLSILPSPVIQVILSATVIDVANSIPSPEIKLSSSSLFATNLEYVSEFELLLRNLGYDPIVHLFKVDYVREAMTALDRDGVVVNGCLGRDGVEVACMLSELGFTKVVGLNPAFLDSVGKGFAGKIKVRQNLEMKKVAVPKKVELEDLQELFDESMVSDATHALKFPLNVTTKSGSQIATTYEEISELKQKKEDVLDSQVVKTTNINPEILIETYIPGPSNYILIAGSSKTPFSPLLVFPVLQVPSTTTTASNAPTNTNLFQNIQSLFLKSQSPKILGTTTASEIKKQLKMQDLARRAYVACGGEFLGLVEIKENTAWDCWSSMKGYGWRDEEFVVVNVVADLQSCEGSLGENVLKSLGVDVEWLM
ncbi:hypothetical protein HK096_002948, partial [Nowakowskiella sp. JEL0078]